MKEGQVHFMSALDMTHSGVSASLNDSRGGLVVFAQDEVHVALQENVPQSYRWESLNAHPMISSDKLRLRS